MALPEDPAARDPRAPDRTQLTPDETVSVVRSEEELVVATEAIPFERVRLVKRVVTETVTLTTEVRREELHVERVPVDADAVSATSPGPERAASGGVRDRLRARVAPLRGGEGAGGPAGRGHPEAFSGEVVEIDLMEEEVVVTKRVVPRERVLVRKDVVAQEQVVTDDVRREKVELIREDVAGGGGLSGAAGRPGAGSPRR